MEEKSCWTTAAEKHDRILKELSSFSYRQPFADVAGVVPAVVVDDLARLLGLLEVSLEHVGALHAHLALALRRIVLHFRHVH